MHVHNVSMYAPTGTVLERTDYEERGTVHRFLRGSDLELLECVIPPGSTGDDEVRLLGEFQGKHTPVLKPSAATPDRASRASGR